MFLLAMNAITAGSQIDTYLRAWPNESKIDFPEMFLNWQVLNAIAMHEAQEGHQSFYLKRVEKVKCVSSMNYW